MYNFPFIAHPMQTQNSNAGNEHFDPVAAGEPKFSALIFYFIYVMVTCMTSLGNSRERDFLRMHRVSG